MFLKRKALGMLIFLFQELKKHKVKDVVRVCEPSYKIEELKNEGINVTDLEFDDGTPPPLRVRACI
jgi:protein tyrosine phosphatase type 4A